MRYLAIDPGGKRTGLALGDDVMRMATPHDVIHAANETQRLQLLLKAIEAEGPGELVLGLPLNMDGSDSAAVPPIRQLARQLEEATGLKVHLVDERLTSAAADAVMSQTGLTHKQKKARRDALAAAAILQDFLDRDVGE